MPKKAKKKKAKGKKGKKGKKEDPNIRGTLFPEFQGSSYQQWIDHIRRLRGELVGARNDNKPEEEKHQRDDMMFSNPELMRRQVTLSLYNQPKPLLEKKVNITMNETFGEDFSMSLINKSYQGTKIMKPIAPPPEKGKKALPAPRPYVKVTDNLKAENNEFWKD